MFQSLLQLKKNFYGNDAQLCPSISEFINTKCQKIDFKDSADDSVDFPIHQLNEVKMLQILCNR